MAGDDDIIIKLSADANAALRVFAQIVTSFGKIEDAVKLVEKGAADAGLSTKQFLDTFRTQLEKSTFAATALGKDFAASLDAVEAKLNTTTTSAEAVTTALGEVGDAGKEAGEKVAAGADVAADSNEKQKLSVESLLETTEKYREQFEIQSEKMTNLSDQERAAIVELAKVMDDAGRSLQDVAKETGLTVDQIQELIKEQDKLNAVTEAAVDPVEELAKVTAAFRQQQADDAIRVSELSQIERQQINAATEELIAQGMSFAKVAAEAELSVGALKMIVDEQEKLAQAVKETEDASKPFWDDFLSNIKSSEVATVTWGIVMAEAFNKMVDGISDAVMAFPEMIQQMAQVGEHLNTMANRLDTTAENIAELDYIGGQVNVSMEQMARTIQNFGIGVSDSGSKTSKALVKLGVDIEALKKVGDVQDQFFAILKFLQELPAGFDKVGEGVKLFGPKFKMQSQLIKAEVEGPGGLRETFLKLGGAENVAALASLSDKFKSNVGNIQLVMDGFKRGITVKMLGPINEVMERLPDLGGAVLIFGQSVGKAAQNIVPMAANLVLLTGKDKGIAGVIESLKSAGPHLTNFSKKIKDTASSFVEMASKSGGVMGTLTKMGDVFESAASGILDFGKGLIGFIPKMWDMTKAVIANTTALLLNPYVLVAAAVVALGFAIYKLIGGWDGLVAVVNSAMEAMKPLITFFVDLYDIILILATQGFTWLIDSIKAAWKWFGQLWAGMSVGTGWLDKLVDGLRSFVTWMKEIPILGHILKAFITYWEVVFTVVAKAWGYIKQFFAWMGKATHDWAEDLRNQEKQQEKTNEEQKKSVEIAKEKVSATQAMLAEEKRLDDILKGMDKTLRSNYAQLLKTKSAKEIAERAAADLGLTLEDATAVFERLKKELSETAKEAKKNPFQKLMADARKMAEQLEEARDSHLSFTDIVEQFGQKAAEIYNRASLRGALKQIEQGTIDVAKAFSASQIKERLDEINKKGLELAKTFTDKIRDGVEAAAAAVVSMQNEITESYLYGSKLREHQIQVEYDARITALNNESVAAAAVLEDTIKKADEAARLDLLFLEKKKLAGEKITAAEREEIELRRQAAINGAAAVLLSAEQNAAKQIEVQKILTARKIELLKLYTKFELEQEEEANEEKLDLVEKDLKQRGAVTLKAREKQYKAEEKLLDAMLAANKGDIKRFYDWEIAEQRRKVERMKSEFQKEAAARKLVTKQSLIDIAKEQRDHLTFVLKHEKEFTKEYVRELKERTIEAEREAEIVGKGFIYWFGQAANAINELGGSFAELGAAMDSEAVVKFGEAMQFVATIMEDVMDVVTAIVKGNYLGAIVGIIKILTKVVAKLWDAFTTSDGEKAMHHMEQTFRDTWGNMLEVTEEYGNEIAATAKKMFWGNDFQAQLYHLSEIIDQAGGLSEKNFTQMSARLRDVFAQIGKGAFTVEHATKILDENFSTFAQHTLESGKIASKGFQEIIALNAQFGAKSKEIADFVSGQVGVLGQAFQKLMSPHAKAATKIAEDLKDQSKDLEEIAKDRDKLIKDLAGDPSRVGEDDKKKLAELTAAWEKQTSAVAKLKGEQGDMAKAAMPDIQRAGRLMMASFNGATASGMGMLDAVDQLGPGLDELLKTTEGLGISVKDAGLEWIVDYRERINANKELVGSSQSLNEIMKAMSNIGALNEDSFRDLQAQGLSTFNQLKEAGFSDNETFKMMLPYLEQVRNAHKELGLPIDENTEAIMKQAQESGILKDQELSTNQLLMDGLSALIEVLGGAIPKAWKKTADAGTKAADDITKGFDQGVKKSVEDTTKSLDKVPWQGFASKALTAADYASRGMKGTTGAIRGVQDELADTDWEAWAKAAVDAAADVEDAVDGVAVGHSPGGIKEIPIKLKEAIGSFRDWSRIAVSSARAVEGAVNASANAEGPGMVGVGSAGGAGAGGGGDVINEGGDVNIHLHVNDASQAELYVERTLLPQMTKVLGRGRGLRDMKNVLGVK